MKCYAAFLRGMNLGRRRIKNDELCACFRDLGFARVTAFLASGNVVFETGNGDAADVERTIETGLLEALAYEVPTFVRTAAEVRAIARCQPFPSALLESRGKPQVALLACAPDRQTARRVLKLATAEDLLEILGRELYWLPKGGVLDSSLDLKGIERALGTMTTRTKRTVERLVAKLPPA